MKTHSADFKNILTSMGRQYDVYIEYETSNPPRVLREELHSVNIAYSGAILKSIMKEVTIECEEELEKDQSLKLYVGLYNESTEQYEYLNYGRFFIYSVEKQEDENLYTIKCYDDLIKSMKDYTPPTGITYPISIKNYLISLLQSIGILPDSASFENIANKNRQIPSELFANQGYTYRDVLDQVAQATGCSLIVTTEGILKAVYVENTNEVINSSFLKDANVTFKEKYGPINSIVLSRGNADNVYLRDEDSVAQYGLHELKIVDNQIMNFNDRSEYLADLLLKLGGLEYYTNDYTSTGILYLEPMDAYQVSIDGTAYRCVMFNDEIILDGGIEENIYTEIPEQAETDYTKADKTDQRINQTYFIVDKQNQTIKSVVTNVTEQDNKIAKITQTVDVINSKISDVVDITETQESMNGSLQFDDVNMSEPVSINIKSTGEYVTFLYPWASGKYPANNLFIQLRTLRFTNTAEYRQTTDSKYRSNKNYYAEVSSQYILLVAGTDYNIGDTITGTIYENTYFDYELPDDLLWYNENVYDELVIEYETQTAQILKRCRRTGKSSVEPLGTTQVIPIPYPSIELTDGDYLVQMLKYDNEPYPCYIKVRVMKKNIYTTQFYTKAEVDSKISQTATSIDLSVDQKLTNYVTEQQMNAAISITASSINSTVTRISNKVDVNTGDITQLEQHTSSLDQRADSIETTVSTKVGKEEVISRINQSAEAIQINANKISLAGKNINLTSDNITIKSTNFSLDKNGNLSCVSATLKNAHLIGGTIDFRGLSDIDQDRILMSGSGSTISSISGRQIFFTDMNNQAYQTWLHRDMGLMISGKSSERTEVLTVRQDLQYLLQISKNSTLIHGNGFRFFNNNGMGEIYINGDLTRLGSGILMVSGNYAYYNGYEIAVNYSDKRLKENIKDTSYNALDIIGKIDHREFDWKDNKKHVNIGYIAQELEKIDNNFVIRNDYIDKEGNKTRDYRIQVNVLPLLATATKAIQELKNEVEELRKKVEE